MVGPMTDVTGTLSTLRERWGAGIVRQGMGVAGMVAGQSTRDAAVSMGALALAPLPRRGTTRMGTPDTSPEATRILHRLPGAGWAHRWPAAPGDGGHRGWPVEWCHHAHAAGGGGGTGQGAIAAWLDLPGRFDPLEAAERGVDLRWLVVVRPTRSADGLRIVGAMLASRSVDLLVLDLPPRMPTDQAGLVRQLAAQARRVGGRVLAIGSGSLTPVIRDALAESSHLRLALAHRDWLRVGREVVGQRVLVTVEKDRAGAPGRATEIEIRYQPDGERGARRRAAPGCRGQSRPDRRADGRHPTGRVHRGPVATSRPSPYRARSSTDPHRCAISISTGTTCRFGWRHRSPSLPSGPVVLGGQPWEPASVLDASPAALRMGVQRGQPLGSAHALAPEAASSMPIPIDYREALEAALEALLAVTPAVEGPVEPTDAAFGRILLGIEGLERLWGDEAAIARRALTTVGCDPAGHPPGRRRQYPLRLVRGGGRWRPASRSGTRTWKRPGWRPSPSGTCPRTRTRMVASDASG